MSSNANLYSSELMNEIKEILRPYNLFYGYTNIKKQKILFDATKFFDYDLGEVTEEDLNLAEGFKSVNLATLAEVCKRKVTPALQYFNVY